MSDRAFTRSERSSAIVEESPCARRREAAEPAFLGGSALPPLRAGDGKFFSFVSKAIGHAHSAEVSSSPGSTGCPRRRRRFLSEKNIMVRQVRTMAGAMVMALLMPVAAGRADEASAVKTIKELGGSFTRDAKQPGKPIVSVLLRGPQVTDTALRDLKQLKRLRSLNLGAAKVTDTGLKDLKHLTSLQTLTLTETRITDAGLKELKGLQSLQTLKLWDTRISDAGLRELKQLKSLRFVDIGSTQITDAGLKELTALKTLHTLNLSATEVSDAGLKELRHLTSLHSLDLSHTPITDAGIKELKNLKRLRTLNLNHTSVTEKGLAELHKALPNLLTTP
ncbi:MAG TPA: hypothetical protein VMG10_12505 [Gemmataceae bacterium]|nr:hypothetical protein [Gemmataceae bacterium]